MILIMIFNIIAGILNVALLAVLITHDAMHMHDAIQNLISSFNLTLPS